MTASPNFWAVYERLFADEDLAPRAASLVEAAMVGGDTLDGVLSDTSVSGPSERERPVDDARGRRRTFVRQIDVQGFRGIGGSSRLRVHPGPGLTLVVGRNGSGKSSFVEGLEVLLTGDSTRWQGRKPKRDWESGWKNLHTDGPVALAAQFTVEGASEPVTVERRWGSGDRLGEGRLSVRRGSTVVEGGLDAFGWQDAMARSRPFLSYNDISGAWERRPSELFDALMGMLGMEDVRAAMKALGDRRRAMDKRARAVRAEVEGLISRLGASSDPRAAACVRALSSKVPDVDALDAVLADVDGEAEDDVLARWRRLASLKAPTQDEVLRAVEALDAAVSLQREVSETRDANLLRTAELLERAVRWHEHVDTDVCPVCGTAGVLGEGWGKAASEQARELRESSTRMASAREALRKALSAGRDLVRRVTPPSGDLAGVEAAVLAHAAWAAAPEEAAPLARHLESTWTELDAAFGACRSQARERLEALHADWRPLRTSLEAWRERYASVLAESTDRDALEQAEAWIKQVDQDLRDEAFEPIAARAKETWSTLRTQSNVDSLEVGLAGGATQRKVSLAVTVDGTDGVALGVMSQGELHALALSLFLPRLLRGDSPFGFVIIDDPVQAMDPAKVDGLARVLHRAAQTHQVVVFTHDPRLPAATRRLGLGADVLEVRRSPSSQVDVRVGQDPVQQHISDAFHLCGKGRDVGDAVVRHVVPGLCRAAVEAALTRRVWREQLARGEAHADIAERIREAGGMHDLGTLAFFGDTTRGSELLRRLNRIHPQAADVFQDLKRHAHTPLPDDVDVETFVSAARNLARDVLR